MNNPANKHTNEDAFSGHVPVLYELTIIAVVAIVYTLLFNVPVLRMAYLSGCHPFPIVVRLLSSVCAAGALFLVLSSSRYLFTLTVPVLFGVTSLASYFIIQYDIVINQNTIALMLGSDIGEMKDLAAVDLLAWVLVHAGIGVCIVFIFNRRRVAAPLAGKTALVLACCILGFYSSRQDPRWSPSASILPFSIVAETIRCRRDLRYLQHLMKVKHDFPYEDFSAGPQDMTVVIILGESSRPDHYHINGYARKTSPELERRGAVSFPNVRSLYSMTSQSIPAMLSRIDPFKDKKIEKSLLAAFSRAGFATSWLSAQAYIGRHNFVATAVMNDADTRRFINVNGDADYSVFNDGLLLDLLDEELSRGKRKKLVVLHTLGSHWRYDNHYPRQFGIFKPISPRGFNPQLVPAAQLINSYDNSILYTDHLIGQVIERVKNDVSLVIFVSDHGESLGEDGFFLHALQAYRDEQHRVAMFAWASERYLAAFGDRYRILRANRTRQFTHRALFHTALDGAGISTRNIDHTKSLFSTRFTGERVDGRVQAAAR